MSLLDATLFLQVVDEVWGRFVSNSETDHSLGFSEFIRVFLGHSKEREVLDCYVSIREAYIVRDLTGFFDFIITCEVK